MKKKFSAACIFIFFIICCNNMFAQTACAWKLVNKDFRLNKNSGKLLFNQQSQTKIDDTTLYTLPVVVHVITTGDAVGSPDNPTGSQISAMIADLNNAFQKKGSSFGGVNMKIKFKLAVRSPNGTSTNGIIRVDGSSLSNYVSGGITNDNAAGSADEVTVKNLSRWPNTDYINIWIVNKIDGSNTAPGGYTYFPEYNSAATDGMVLLASVVNGTNKTVVHEMGHYFSLYHTFHDDGNETTCAANDDCSNEGDKVCDTEPVLNVACGTSTNSCNNDQPFIIADAQKHYTVLNNFMSYTNCQWMFTKGQKERARSALLNFRHGLISSNALTPPDSLVPVAACVPTATYGLSPYYGVQKVEFNTLSVYSNSSQADGAIYIDRTVNQSTTVIQGMQYRLKITGSYGNPHYIRVFMDYNNDGDFSDAHENIFSMRTDTAKKTITIPLTGVVTNTPLRMRVIADDPSVQPTSCKLNGTAINGAGQAEDYTVIVLPSQAIAYENFKK